MFTNRGFMPFFAIMLGIFLFMSSAFIQAQTNIGVNYNQVGNEVGWGLNADTEFNLLDLLKVEVGLNGQNTGSLYQGKFVTEVGREVGPFEIAVASETSLIGTQITALGRDTSIGLKGTANIGSIGIVVGVFGANAGEFGPRNAQDILVDDNGFDPRQFEGLGLNAITAPSNHLSLKNGNRLNLRIGLETKIWNDRIEVGISGRPEIGADENPVHQLIVTGKTGLDVGNNLKIILHSEFAVQTWENGYEKQWASGFNLSMTR
jgi:hypothetical protein